MAPENYCLQLPLFLIHSGQWPVPLFSKTSEQKLPVDVPDSSLNPEEAGNEGR
jgi:hypothetical protein